MFFGTSSFAVPSLRALREHTDLAAVVTQPDRPAGRGQRLQPTAVKIVATEFGVNVLAPERVRDVLEALREIGADLFVVASYGKILPQAVLDLPKLGAFNVHPSLLPLYRGATPLQSQIRDLVAATGVTIIAMDAGMDTGDVLLRERTPLDARETYGELEVRLAELGAGALVRTIQLAESGALAPIAQSTLASEAEIDATITRPLRDADLQVDWAQTASRVDALVRSLSPQPCARARIGVIDCKVVATHPLETAEGKPSGTPFRIPRGLGVACAEGAVSIDRVIPANRSAMSGEAFAASLFAKA